MNPKRFSRPDWRRIVIFIVIYIILACFVMTIGITEKKCGFVTQQGFPFHYFFATGGACKKNGAVQMIEFRAHFSSLYLIFDVLIWGLISYFLSCLLMWIYNKMKNFSR